MAQISENVVPSGSDRSLRAMFEARKRVFVDMLHWDVPVLAGKYELDQFDTSDATYLVLSDENGEHRASTRLLRTDRPHILSHLFPSLCGEALPYGPETREITRFCIEPTLPRDEQRRVRNQLVTAVAEHALATGAQILYGSCQLRLFCQIERFGWDCRALGEPRAIGGEALVALLITIDRETPARLAANGIYDAAGFRLASMPGKALVSAPDCREGKRSLEADGYCILRGLLPSATIAALETDLECRFARTPFGIGDFYGHRTKRFGSLLRRSSHAEELVLQPQILELVRAVLGEACERIQLNVAQAIEIHPGEVEQFPHRDHDMWQCAKGAHEYLVNVIWPLTPFTASNGATRLYPGSHREEIGDLDDLGEAVAAECNPGDAIVFLGSTVHGAGPNLTGAVRRGVVIGYSLGWLKPYENLWLAYPPEIARSFSKDLAELGGYSQHRPNLGNYEGQCPSILLGDRPDEYIRAVDALRSDQEEAVHEFAMSRQRRE